MKTELEIVNQLSTNTGITIDDLHEIMATQVILEATADVVLVLIFVYSMWFACNAYKQSGFNSVQDWLEDSSGAMCSAVLGFCGGVFLIPTVMELIQIAINPRYWAIHELFKQR
jgi:hypothetical protein